MSVRKTRQFRGKRTSRAGFERLWNSELTLVEIGEALGGITSGAVIARAKRFDLPVRQFDGRNASQEDADKLRHLWAAGVSASAIGRHIGLSPTAVRMRAMRLKLERRGRKPCTPLSQGLETWIAAQMAASAAQTRAALKAHERASQKLLRLPVED